MDTVISRFERVAARNPEAPAVVAGPDRWSYGELLGAAEGVAASLSEEGIGPGSRVGVACDRSADTVAAMFGISLAGASFVPFVSDAANARQADIARRAEVRVMVGSPAALDRRGAPGPLRALAVQRQAPGHRTTTRPTPDDEAYVVFTSGSTGTPKGVVVRHAQLLSSTMARFDVFPLPATRYVMLAPFTFDAALAGTYFTLLSGGSLIVPTEAEIADPALLGRLIATSGATHVDGVPSLYGALLEFAGDALAEVRCAIVAGEALPISVVARHFAVAPACRLFNEYGPTEGTVWSTVFECRADLRGPLTPIGRPIAGCRTYVLDERLDPVADGALGQLFIAGAGIAKGYLDQPVETAARFMPDPDSPVPGARMYATGDLVSQRDGDLICHGRQDDQLKIRGFRVEPIEVEAAIVSFPGIRAAVVVPHETATGTVLRAWLELGGAEAAWDDGMRRRLSAHLADLLPEFMIPGEWQVAPSLPLTPHGKVDRRALGAKATVGAAREDAAAWRVVANAEERLSIWPVERTLPDGWHPCDVEGTRGECLSAVDAMAKAPASPAVAGGGG